MLEPDHTPDLPIDTGFNFRDDRPGNKDPDSWSPTLRRYHRLLWSKPLPGGEPFDLVESGKPGGYFLEHQSALGDFHLTSDAITHRYLNAPVVKQIPADEVPLGIGYTIGSAILFPGTRIDNKQTINMARGTHPRIRDRFDLTLECIRRHYEGEPSPLSDVLQRYADFFALFRDFRGYVDFFLLQDLVPDGETVSYFHHFDDFKTPPVPDQVSEYLAYRERSSVFIDARNIRIRAYAAEHLRNIDSPEQQA